MWQNENAPHLEILIAEQKQSIRQSTVTKNLQAWNAPKHYEESLPVMRVAFRSHLMTGQSVPLFFLLKVLKPVSGTSSTWKKKATTKQKLEVFNRIPCIVLLKTILIFQLFTYFFNFYVFFQLSCNFWNLQEELHTFLFQMNLQRLLL